MPTVKFLIQGTSGNVPIYLRLSAGRGNAPKRKTYLNIDPKDWSSSRGFPKSNNATNKNLTSELRKLEDFVLDKLNDAAINQVEVGGNWLQFQIDSFFGKTTIDDTDYLTSYGELFLKNLKYRVNEKTKSVGVSDATRKKYRTIVNKLIAFDNYKKSKTKLKDVDLKWRNEFIGYLDEVDRLGENSIGRYLKFVKSICLDAEKNGYTVNKQLKNFKGYSVEAIKVVLNFEEIEKIASTVYLDEKLKITSDWLIIGCYTGQRVSDLLRMNKSMIKTIKGHEFIVLTQQKTKKIVHIPIHKKVKELLDNRNGNFPPDFTNNIESSKAIFNRCLKQVAKIAGIDNVEKGLKFDPESKRKISGNFPKYELIASHICRRSFATNFYASEIYPTPLLMNITGHSTEKMFLTYIGKKPLDYGLQLAKIWQDLEEKEIIIKKNNKVIELTKNYGGERK